MVDFINEQFTSIVKKCLEKNSKELKVPTQNLSLVFKLDNDGEVEYRIYKNYAFEKVLTFMQVLGVKIDLKGYSLFVPNFIEGSLNRISEQENIPKSDINIIVFFHEGKDMRMMVYNKTIFVKYITLESLFDSKDMPELA
jgi:hypothetical protein